MKAMVREEYCSPEGLELRDVDRPVPRADEVLVRVRAAGVDQGTWHVLTGLPLLGRLAFGPRRPRSAVLGMDLAGVVEETGAAVTDLRPGDEVFGVGRGAFAEYACARASKLVRKPANLTFEQAGAVAVSGCTALTALRGVQAGQRVLVIGAGGGVGSYAVQLAVAAGASVTGVCGPGKVALVRALGATEVVDRTRSDLRADRYDLVLDIAGNRPVAALRAVVAPRGTLVFVGGEEGGRWSGGMGRTTGAVVRSWFTRQRTRAPISVERPADLERLRSLIAGGEVTPALDRAFSLGDLPAAITYLREGRAQGKIVVTP